MQNTPSNAEPSPALSSLIQAAYHQGWLMAGRALQHLETAGILPGREKRRQQPVSLSPEILMELAAVLCLSSWLEGGLCDSLPEGAAPAFAALGHSEAQFAAGPQAFAQEEGLPPLTAQVFALWEQHLAWSGLEELNADVLLDHSPADEEMLLNTLADFLWQQRHTGQHLTGG